MVVFLNDVGIIMSASGPRVSNLALGLNNSYYPIWYFILCSWLCWFLNEMVKETFDLSVNLQKNPFFLWEYMTSVDFTSVVIVQRITSKQITGNVIQCLRRTNCTSCLYRLSDTDSYGRRQSCGVTILKHQITHLQRICTHAFELNVI